MKRLTYWTILAFIFLHTVNLSGQLLRKITPALSTFCEKGANNFEVESIPSDMSYTWQKRKVGEILETDWMSVQTGQNATYSVMDVPLPGEEYRVIIETPGNPSLASDIAVMNVVATPTQVNFEGVIMKCAGIATTITVTNALFDIEWSGPTGQLGNDNSISVIEPGTYNATISIANSSECTLTDNVIIGDFSLPNVSISVDPPDKICSNTPVTLTETGGNTSGWSWQGPDGTSSLNEVWVVDAPQNEEYSVTVKDNNGCENSASIILSVLPAPSVEILPAGPANLEVCSSIGLQLAVSGGTFMAWNWAGPGSFDSNITSNPYVTNPGAGQYAVTVTGTNGCTATDVKTAVNPPGLNAPIAPNLLTICNGAPVTMQPGNNSVNGYTYLWSDQTTTWSFSTDMPGTYTVTITAPTTGCTASFTATVQSMSQSGITIDGPESICLNAQNQIYKISGNFDSYKWTVNGGANNADDSKAFANITWENNHADAWVTVEVKVGTCTYTDKLEVSFTTDTALPAGDIILKPSKDILLFAKELEKYPDSLLYDWGALVVIDSSRGITKDTILPTTMSGVDIFNNLQYYYVDSIDPNLVYYVNIMRIDDGCITTCYWPAKNLFAKTGATEPPPVTYPAAPVNARIVPNPNTGVFEAQLPDVFDGAITYRLHHSTGAIAASGSASVASGLCSFDFPAGYFPPGLYYLSVLKERFGLQTNLKVIIK